MSFWQVTGSLVGALDVPPGHGHRYGAGLVDGLVDAGAAAPPARAAAVRAAVQHPGAEPPALTGLPFTGSDQLTAPHSGGSAVR